MNIELSGKEFPKINTPHSTNHLKVTQLLADLVREVVKYKSLCQ